jgi:hypothetical protein
LLCLGLIPKNGYVMRQNQSKIALQYLVYLEEKIGIQMIHAGRGPEKYVAGALVDGYFEHKGRKYVVQVNCHLSHAEES